MENTTFRLRVAPPTTFLCEGGFSCFKRLKPSFFDRKTDEIKKAIIGANDAIASVRAKPKMA